MKKIKNKMKSENVLNQFLIKTSAVDFQGFFSERKN